LLATCREGVHLWAEDPGPMPVVRPAGIQCPKWEPVQLGSKRCRYYVDPAGPGKEGLCKLPDELLCVEWVRRNGSAEQRAALATRSSPVRAATVPDAPAPLALVHPAPPPPRAPATLSTPQGALQMAQPRPYEPAKEVDPASLEALERAGVEVELSAPHLDGGITLVPRRTGRTDRSEVTFREAATIRLIVDCFPGAHVTAYRSGVPTPAEEAGVSEGAYAEEMAVGTGSESDPTRDLPWESCPLSGTRCAVCGGPQRRTGGGLACASGHGGAEPEDPLS